MLLSLSIAAFGINLKDVRRPGRIGRAKGIVWLVAFAVYLSVMLYQECGAVAR